MDKIDSMNSLSKIRLTVTLVFIVLYAVIFTISLQDKEKRIQYILDQKIQDLDINYRISSDYFKTVSDNAFHLVINKPTVLELLYQAKTTKDEEELAKIRATLNTKLQPLYKRLTHSGVIIIQFAFENNHSLLRLHKPSKFADDLSKVRYSYTYTNKHKKIIRGFEQGKVSHAFRNIFPITYKDEYLGSVDISFSSESLQDRMTKAHKTDTHFILSKDLFETNIWKAQKKIKYVQSIEHENFLFALTPVHKIEDLKQDKTILTAEIKEQIKNNVSHKNAFSLYTKVNDTVKIITFSPIKNIKNKETVAYLVSYTDSPYLDSILNDYFWIHLSVIIGLLTLLVLVDKIIQNRFFLQKEVRDKTQELQLLNNNLQNELQKQIHEIRKKDGILLEQARLASMGEMIGNIAHQWRQPLNALGLLLQKTTLLYQRNKLDDQSLKSTVDRGMTLINQMSNTIDDFRFFLQDDQGSETFKLFDTVQNCHSLLSATLEQHSIELTNTTDEDILIQGHTNHLTQVLLNIINNAKDALIENGVKDPLITVSGHSNNNSTVIDIADNAGGIPNDILNKIFDPYFTTKQEGQGTGIGLFMSKRIIEEGMEGILRVSNTDVGAKFSIILPQDYRV